MSGCKVLLVDDEQEFACTLAERLTLRGIRVQVASGGSEALEAIAQETPEVVVLDLMMPGMNGLAVLARIKSAYPDVQVILLTGMGSAEDGAEGTRLGAFDCLMKPLKIEDLIHRIRDAVATRARGVD